MTKSKNDDVKRYWVEHGRGRLTAIYEEKVDGLDDDAFEVVRATDHDREVGNLIYELSSANATITELEDLIDIKNDAISNMQIELHSLETELATARKVIEKLREQRDDWISTCILNDPDVQDEEATIANYVEADDAEIEAIERGKDKT